MLFQIPWDALLGGVLIGLAATLLLALNGKIAGISGIVGGLIQPKAGDFSWRLLFLVGMVTAGVMAPWLGFSFPDYGEQLASKHIVVAGLLVGVGTRLGNGCTSGHGVCGVGRLSKRSIVATSVFMGVAILTVFIRL